MFYYLHDIVTPGFTDTKHNECGLHNALYVFIWPNWVQCDVYDSQLKLNQSGNLSLHNIVAVSSWSFSLSRHENTWSLQLHFFTNLNS